MIRFRVIANSNKSEDIIMKEKVVKTLSNLLFKNNDSIEDTRNNVISNINNIETKIDKLFKKNKYDMTYNISYGLNHFPKKEYNGQVFSEGDYESLVIEIGEAKGNNYFCILYPPLCMIDEDKTDEVKYDFKIVELLKKLF
jgi:stage II sporulation protein R